MWDAVECRSLCTPGLLGEPANRSPKVPNVNGQHKLSVVIDGSPNLWKAQRAHFCGVDNMDDGSPKTDADWRALLSSEEYRVLREQGTEAAFSGKYWDEKRPGIYRCRGCGSPLFTASAKYDSGTGGPSFFEPVDNDAVATETDNSLFMARTEVHCSRCSGHLGHLFPDGPQPTGLRYCVNSCSLELDQTETSRDSLSGDEPDSSSGEVSDG